MCLLGKLTAFTILKLVIVGVAGGECAALLQKKRSKVAPQHLSGSWPSHRDRVRYIMESAVDWGANVQLTHV